MYKLINCVERLSGVIAVVFLLMNFPAIAAQNPGISKSTEVSDRVIVKYKNNNRLNMASARGLDVASRVSQVAGDNLQHVRQMMSGAHVMKLKAHRPVSALTKLVEKMNADPDIEYAEVDVMLHPKLVPDDSRYNEQWQYFEATAGMNMPAAWDMTQGLGSVVAVLDTGYRPHADLQGNILQGYDMISDNVVAQDGGGRDSDAQDVGDWAPAGVCYSGSPASNSSWHGTHVAGSIAAVGNNSTGVTGAAYKAKIVPVRVLGRCGGYTSDIADGIIWAAGGSVSGVSNNLNPADVINLSLGGAGSCGFTQQNAIDIANSLGATVIVAAGNENTNVAGSTPANCNGVVTVAAVNRNGGRAYYSNYGTAVDLAAPGGDTRYSQANGILSTLNSGTSSPGSDTYAFYQGTSMATPHVAGVAALLYSKKPGINPVEVEQILKTTSRAFPSTCSGCGAGMVDAYAAVKSLDTTAPPSTTKLDNGVAKTGLSATMGNELRYTIDVPAGATSLSFISTGGTGDADLYVRFGSAPTETTYDCRPYIGGNNETCNISNVQAGTYHVMLRAYSSFSNVTLLASFNEPVAGGSLQQLNLSGAAGSWKHFSLVLPAGVSVLDASISSGTGDADLYVRYGSMPTTSSYNCRPYLSGNNENCNIKTPQAGTWYISVRAYSSYTGVNLDAIY